MLKLWGLQGFWFVWGGGEGGEGCGDQVFSFLISSLQKLLIPTAVLEANAGLVEDIS